MRAAGHVVHRAELPPECGRGTFVAPTIVELPDLSALTQEVFGPVLHVVRFRRDGLDALMDGIAALGYGLTFGLHTRIDATGARVLARAPAGNAYVNRTIVGAVVGVQPFGGHGLSGTGPKAGGPLYLRRLLSRRPVECGLPPGPVPSAFTAWQAWRAERGLDDPREVPVPVLVGSETVLAGPVGEENRYGIEPAGVVICVARDEGHLLRQVGNG